MNFLANPILWNKISPNLVLKAAAFHWLLQIWGLGLQLERVLTVGSSPVPLLVSSPRSSCSPPSSKAEVRARVASGFTPGPQLKGQKPTVPDSELRNQEWPSHVWDTQESLIKFYQFYDHCSLLPFWELLCRGYCQSDMKVKVLVTQSYPTFCDPMDCSLPGSSVHGILQARILEWGAISYSRESFRPRDQTEVSHIASRFFTIWATRESPI